MNDIIAANSIYNNSLKLLDELQLKMRSEIVELNNFDIEQIENIEADMDVYDYLFSIVFGVIGATVSSSDFVKNKFDSIHSDSNKETPHSILGKLLNHYGDAMDMTGGKFIKRDGTSSDMMFHRLLFGHDPLSFGSDNPFTLMMQSNGIIKGIFSAFRHLVADIFSKQGLPLPGHSYFDFVNSDGKLTNHLAEISKKLANNDRVKSQNIFSRMFTIRAQDVASQGIVWAACKGYFYARKIEDDTRQRQIKIISYSVNFFGHAVIGMIKQGGVPYINWPSLLAVINELIGLYTGSYKEIRKLEKITDQIVSENIKLEEKIFNTGKNLNSYDCSESYIQELNCQYNSFDNFTGFFEEDKICQYH